MGVNPFEPQSWNRYTYVVNRPVSYVDENGLWPKETHYTMSYMVGRMSGLSAPHSHVLGSALFSVDKGATAPWHFWDPADQRRWHAFGSPDLAPFIEWAENSATLWALGRNLHPVQDWYARPESLQWLCPLPDCATMGHQWSGSWPPEERLCGLRRRRVTTVTALERMWVALDLVISGVVGRRSAS